MMLPAGIHQIPLPTTLSVGSVNCYLLTGRVLTLVDPGPFSTEALSALCQALEAKGVRLEEIEQVVITHPHSDHVGMARTVTESSGAAVVAHRCAAGSMNAPEETARRMVRLLQGWGRLQGVPAEMLDQIICQYLYWGEENSERCEADLALDDHDELAAGDGTWRVIYTPGHSSGHICLLRESDGVLLSGDLLLPSAFFSPVLEPADDVPHHRLRSGADYLDSLARLSMYSFQHVLPGHGGPFSADAALLRSRIAAARAGAESVYLELCREPRTVWELNQLLFPRAHPSKYFFTLSIVAGYLDLLTAHGRVACMIGRGGVIRSFPLMPAVLAGA